MPLTQKQKKYIKKHYRKDEIEELASHLNVPSKEIHEYLKKRWGEQKYYSSPITKKSILKEQNNSNIYTFKFADWLKQNFGYLLLLGFLVIIAYANSLSNGFVSDDIATIVKNPQITKFSSVYSSGIFFLRQFFFFIVSNLFGVNPWAFRLLNIFFHLGNVLLIYLIICILINKRIALLVSSIFAVHPLQSEAITWISGGPYSQYSFFLLLSLVFYLFSLKKDKYFYYSIISWLLAIFTSEKAIVFPIILLIFNYCFPAYKKNMKKLMSLFGIGLIGMIILSFKLIERLNGLQAIHYQKPAIYNPLQQIPIAISSYLQLIVWPKGLTLYHSEMAFTPLEFAIRFLVCALFIFSIIFSIKRNKQYFFWSSFFVITLLPSLTPLSIAWIVAERYAYLGTLGIYICFALLIYKLFNNQKLKPLMIGVFVLIIIAFLARTIVRNFDWKTEDTLWLANSKTSPSSSQNHNNLGDYYARNNNLEKAAEEFKTAIRLQPNYGDAFHNLANVYYRMGKIDEAIYNYEQALTTNPRLWQSYQNLAAISFSKGEMQKTEEFLNKAIGLVPTNPNLHLNLAMVLVNQNKFDEAKKELKIVLDLEPQNEQAKNMLLKLP